MRQEIEHFLVQARAELKKEKVERILSEALRQVQTWRNATGAVDAYILEAEILSEQALNAQLAKQRFSCWEAAVEITYKGWEKTSSPRIASELGARTVDFVQDKYATILDADILRKLRKALKTIDEACNSNKNEPILFAELLSHKSALLRHRAMQQEGKELKRKDIEEALRCAQLACRKYSSLSLALLEKGLALWASARFACSDSDYTNLLREADSSFIQAQSMSPVDVIPLARARFYRLTYQATAACEVFENCAAVALNKRRIYRESIIYAESVLQLWYGNYPPNNVRERLEQAASFLETALDAGYTDARTVVNLAFITAALGDIPSAESALLALHPSEKIISWQDVIGIVSKANLTDLPSLGLALGIESGAVWTKLGTYAKVFLKDLELAENLYREAIKLSPKDPTVYTNLSRLLLEKGDEKDFAEIDALLRKAGNYADRRFTWWRELRAKLNEIRNRHPLPTLKKMLKWEYSNCLRSHKTRQETFQAIEECEDPGERGRHFEEFINALVDISFISFKPSYRIPTRGTKRSYRQVDGAFEHKGRFYRMECKWLNERANRSHIADFVDKLEAAGVSGVFISMSGFDEGAIDKVSKLVAIKCILLVDGEEVRSVVNGSIAFDALIDLKISYFNYDSNSYFKYTGEI